VFGSALRGVDTSDRNLESQGEAMTLLPGSQLGRYQLESLIASGGMGEVFRARDTTLGRPVALKVLLPGVPMDANRLARFAQEARTTAQLNHPNIVGVLDVGSHDGLPYIVSELLHGRTLRERLNDGPLPLDVALGYGVEIARGRVAAHDAGVVHRDLKPENIFITADRRVKILDFGLAKCRKDTLGLPQQDSSKSTQPGTILGTVGYMSPEQVRGIATDARADIFSCGVILYEMISGVAPFHGDSAVETLHAILKDEAPPLRVPLECPPAVERLVRHCLEKDPNTRFQSALDVAFVLELMIDFPPLAAPRRRTSRKKAWGGLLQSILSLL
jgi:serine/threonine protein kinase